MRRGFGSQRVNILYEPCTYVRVWSSWYSCSRCVSISKPNACTSDRMDFLCANTRHTRNTIARDMSSDAVPLLAALIRLWNDAYDCVRGFPKLDKHLIGSRLLDDLDQCVACACFALRDRNARAQHLIHASVAFDQWKLLLRTAVKRALISERWYVAHMDTITEVGKMIGGWQRATLQHSDYNRRT